jgi:hypothetical protein
MSFAGRPSPHVVDSIALRSFAVFGVLVDGHVDEAGILSFTPCAAAGPSRTKRSSPLDIERRARPRRREFLIERT